MSLKKSIFYFVVSKTLLYCLNILCRRKSRFLFENAAEIVCWLKTPAEMGGKERYQNMILFHERFLPLLQDCPQNELKAIADTFKATKKLMLKVNSLREQAGLSAIEI